MTGPEIPSSYLGSLTFFRARLWRCGAPSCSVHFDEAADHVPSTFCHGLDMSKSTRHFCAPTLPTSPTSHSPSSTVPPRVHQVESARGQRAAWLGRAHSPLPSRTPRLCVFLVPPATPFDTSILCACFFCLYRGGHHTRTRHFVSSEAVAALTIS